MRICDRKDCGKMSHHVRWAALRITTEPSKNKEQESDGSPPSSHSQGFDLCQEHVSELRQRCADFFHEIMADYTPEGVCE